MWRDEPTWKVHEPSRSFTMAKNTGWNPLVPVNLVVFIINLSMCWIGCCLLGDGHVAPPGVCMSWCFFRPLPGGVMVVVKVNDTKQSTFFPGRRMCEELRAWSTALNAEHNWRTGKLERFAMLTADWLDSPQQKFQNGSGWKAPPLNGDKLR